MLGLALESSHGGKEAIEFINIEIARNNSLRLQDFPKTSCMNQI